MPYHTRSPCLAHRLLQQQANTHTTHTLRSTSLQCTGLWHNSCQLLTILVDALIISADILTSKLSTLDNMQYFVLLRSGQCLGAPVCNHDCSELTRFIWHEFAVRASCTSRQPKRKKWSVTGSPWFKVLVAVCLFSSLVGSITAAVGSFREATWLTLSSAGFACSWLLWWSC